MGGVVKGAFNVVKSVAKFGINMVKSVIKNPLPTILSIGLNFVAPGIAGFTGLPEWAVKGIGRAAISAANGGSLAGIVAAGITPYFNSPTFQNSMVGGLLKDASSFISSPIKNLLGDNWVSNVISSSLTDSSVAGLVAAVSGQDIIKAMGSEFVTSSVTAGIGKVWDTLKTELPKLLETETEIKQKYNRVQDSQGFIDQVQAQQNIINNLVEEMNAPSEKYQQLKSEYDTKLAEYNNAVAIEDVGTANRIANELNENIIPKLEEVVANYGDFADTYVASNLMPQYEQAKAYLDSLINNNKSLIDDYISDVNDLGLLQKNYELGVGKVLAENADFRMTDAIAKGDFTEASKFYNELETYNNQILSLDPNAITVTPSIDLSAQTLLKDIYSTADETLKNQLIAQANLNQQFNDIRTQVPVSTPVTPTVPETPAPVQPTPTQPTVPEIPAPVEPTPTQPTIPVTPVQPTPPTDDRAPGYAELPTLPEGGIGQPAPNVPTTPTTPPSGTGSNIIDNIISGAGNTLQNALIGGAAGAITNEILGNEPPRRPPPVNKPRPPSKVDVSTLTPFTGTLPSGLAPTPTGGLPTNTTQTPTQTPNSGLTSTTQPKTPPTKVDVSTLTPVTDMNWLKSLGIVQG